VFGAQLSLCLSHGLKLPFLGVLSSCTKNAIGFAVCHRADKGIANLLTPLCGEVNIQGFTPGISDGSTLDSVCLFIQEEV